MDLQALIPAVTALVVAVTALIKIIRHQKSVDPHPGVMVSSSQVAGSGQTTQKGPNDGS